MDLYEAIESRHSYRAFHAEPVDGEALDRVLRAAISAPSSMNLQPWSFHVATGARRDEVGEIMALSTVHLQEYIDVMPAEKLEAAERFFATLGNAPVVVAVAVPIAGDELQRINSYVSTGCALENLMLAATAEGLGCCTITFSFWVRDQLARALCVDDSREIVSLVLIGRPAEEPHAVVRRAETIVYCE
ncbi:MAG: nitroreductase family protein [Coriobacteriia bacterium]|nr:nitroreductase family protein [Coriobacteriia bacterium]